MAKVAFIQEKLVEKIGIMSIAATLKQHGHECEVFCEDVDKNFVQSIIKYDPTIVGFGITTYEQKFAVRIMNEIKQINNNIITVLGGIHATIFTDIINQESVDIIVRGEGEFSMLELMDRIDRKQDYADIMGLWVKKEGQIFKNPLRPLIQDLDVLPIIDRNIYYAKYPSLRNARTKPFMASRGCPFQCSFCFNNVYARMFRGKGTYLRYRKPENVIKEICQVKEKYGLDWVQFHDSTFNSSYQYLLFFLQAYKKNGQLSGFICNVRAEGLDENVILLMKEAGCDKVTMGIQHGKKSIRQKLANRGGKQSNEGIITTCKLFKKHKIRIYTDFILGWPGETVADAFESVRLARLIHPTGINSYLMSPFPGTDIQKYAVENGYLDPNLDVDCLPDDLRDNKPVFNQPDIKQLINLQKLFYVASRYPIVEPLIRLLIKIPPNKFFTFVHGLPHLLRILKYDAKTPRAKVKHVVSYFREIFQLEA